MTLHAVTTFVCSWTLTSCALFVAWTLWRKHRHAGADELPVRPFRGRYERGFDGVLNELASIEAEVLTAFPPDQRRRVRARLQRAYAGGITAILVELRRILRSFVGAGLQLRRIMRLALRRVERILRRIGFVATLHDYETRRERAHERVDIGGSFRPRAPGISSARLHAAAPSCVLTLTRLAV